MSSESFDLIVIGAGPGGYTAAIRASQLGMKVACVDKRGVPGGTCLNVGCIPSKALLESSEHYHNVKTKYAKHGVVTTGVSLDLDTMMKRKDAVVRQLTTGIGGLFKKNKITWYASEASLAGYVDGKHRVTLKNAEGSSEIVASKILIATGSAPAQLPNLPFDGKKILDSTAALAISKVPARLAVVGGGYIGLEMGSVWKRLGSEVTIIEFADRIVPAMDIQIGKELHKALAKLGMEFMLGTECLVSKIKGDKVVLQLKERATAKTLEWEGDLVLACTGRVPFTDKLGLDKVGIKLDAKGRVEVNAHFESNVKGIYAVGDVIAGPMLAHKAEDEAVAVAEIMAGQKGHVNYAVIPAVVYTWPEVATVGQTEEELKTANIAYKVGTFPFLANARAKAMDDTDGLVKILADAKTDKVLGVHIIGPRAGEVIHEAVAVMEFGGSAEDIARTCHAHPTLSEAVREAALAVDKRTINF